MTHTIKPAAAFVFACTLFTTVTKYAVEWTKADAVTYFDELKLQILNRLTVNAIGVVKL